MPGCQEFGASVAVERIGLDSMQALLIMMTLIQFLVW